MNMKKKIEREKIRKMTVDEKVQRLFRRIAAKFQLSNEAIWWFSNLLEYLLARVRWAGVQPKTIEDRGDYQTLMGRESQYLVSMIIEARKMQDEAHSALLLAGVPDELTDPDGYQTRSIAFRIEYMTDLLESAQEALIDAEKQNTRLRKGMSLASGLSIHACERVPSAVAHDQAELCDCHKTIEFGDKPWRWCGPCTAKAVMESIDND